MFLEYLPNHAGCSQGPGTSSHRPEVSQKLIPEAITVPRRLGHSDWLRARSRVGSSHSTGTEPSQGGFPEGKRGFFMNRRGYEMLVMRC